MKKPMRIYADTSVFGGVFDAKFEDASVAFFDLVRKGRFLTDCVYRRAG